MSPIPAMAFLATGLQTCGVGKWLGWELHEACILPFDEFAMLPLELLNRSLAKALFDEVSRNDDGQAVTGL